MNQRLMGLWITYTKKIIKNTRWEDGNKITTHPSVRLSRRKAMIIGERWLPNGKTVYDSGWSGEDGSDSYFNHIDTTHCLLVVEGSRTNPFWVDINGATLLDGTLVSKVIR